MNQFWTRFLALEHNYLETCNQTDSSQVSSILAMFFLINARFHHHILMDEKHELSSKSSSSIETDTKIVNDTKGNLSHLSTKTNNLILLACQIENLSFPSRAGDTVVSSSSFSASDLASTLRDRVLELTIMVNDLAIETYANCTIFHRMRCDMHDLTFYLQDASEYLVSIGAADELLPNDSSSSHFLSETVT